MFKTLSLSKYRSIRHSAPHCKGPAAASRSGPGSPTPESLNDPPAATAENACKPWRSTCTSDRTARSFFTHLIYDQQLLLARQPLLAGACQARADHRYWWSTAGIGFLHTFTTPPWRPGETKGMAASLQVDHHQVPIMHPAQYVKSCA